MMQLRILCCNPDGGAFLHITRGWEDAFKALGHSFKRWQGSDRELKNFKPDIYLGCSGWRQNFPKWAKEEFKTKVGIHVNPWGSTVLQALPGEPNINESTSAIAWTKSQFPDFVYCYGNDDDISHMWNFWEDKAGIPVVAMPNGGNSIKYKPIGPGIEKHHFICDVGFVGGYWPYKAMNLDKYLMPVIRNNNIITKIWGWGGWKHIGRKYQGSIKYELDVNTLFSSAKVCPSVVEPHTSRYGIDIPERMFKVPLGGGFTICDPVKNLDKYVDYNTFITSRNPTEYLEQIIYYINSDKARIDLAKKQRLAVLKDHTYLHRIQGFLRQSGYNSQADEAQKLADKYYEEA
jgi:hypothetical protein